MTTLHTVRLILRPWRDSDLEPFAALNADPDVMRHFPAVLDRDQSDRFAGRLRDLFEPAGWGLWAVEVRAGEPFIGFVGLSRPNFTAHFTPAVEIGWRLAKTAWGMGYATEAARAAVGYGFDQLRLDEVVSFTSVGNASSRRVMESWA